LIEVGFCKLWLRRMQPSLKYKARDHGRIVRNSDAEIGDVLSSSHGSGSENSRNAEIH
jgi:hypothetical protein